MLWHENAALASINRVSHRSRMGFSCSSSGLALPRIRFLASAYSASLCARDLTGKAGLLAEWGLLSTPLVVGRFRMRICGGGPAVRLSSWITMGTLGGDLDFLLLKRKIEIKIGAWFATACFSLCVSIPPSQMSSP